jgi:late competence protein required for DNA uptake (superfamily II DNA/RNA helicase)
MNSQQLERELKACDKQRRMAWAKYYQELDKRWTEARIIVRVVEKIDTEDMPSHITTEFYDMAMSLKKEFECPVCLTMPDTKENFKVTKCGHIYCKTCLEQLKQVKPSKCAICRENI